MSAPPPPTPSPHDVARQDELSNVWEEELAKQKHTQRQDCTSPRDEQVRNMIALISVSVASEAEWRALQRLWRALQRLWRAKPFIRQQFGHFHPRTSAAAARLRLEGV
ncbi:hypothetical protein J6590_028269 [Homalodisca vitripennis]|nr:hypothetical protein J6590_028269 [Homalodisca vitripennis]